MPVNLYAASPVLTVTAFPSVTESPVVAEPDAPVVRFVYALMAVPTVTESPVETVADAPVVLEILSPVVKDKTSFATEVPVTTVFFVTLVTTFAGVTAVTTVFFEILGISVVVPPVTTVLNVALVTTVLAVTGFKVLLVVPAVCTAIVPAGVKLWV